MTLQNFGINFSYLHGEGVIPFMIVMYAALVIAWTAIVYALIKFWQSRKKKK